MASTNLFNIRDEIKPVNEGGRRVIAKAQSYLGTAESPALSYTGTKINEWNSYFSASGIAWAGSFATAMYIESDVSDNGIGDPNPAVMFARAIEKERVSPIGFPGCFVVFGVFSADRKTLVTPKTVEIFVRWHNISHRQAVTIGGCVPIGSPSTTNRVVKMQFRNIALPVESDPTQRALFIVPTSVSLREAKIK